MESLQVRIVLYLTEFIEITEQSRTTQTELGAKYFRSSWRNKLQSVVVLFVCFFTVLFQLLRIMNKTFLAHRHLSS